MSQVQVLIQELSNRGFNVASMNINEAHITKNNRWILLQKDFIEGTYVVGVYDQNRGDFIQEVLFESTTLAQARVQYYKYVRLLLTLGYMEYSTP